MELGPDDKVTKPFTVVLSESDFKALQDTAEQEGYYPAQLARVYIKRGLEEDNRGRDIKRK